MKILLPGAAGFVGFHTAKRLLSDGHTVFALDNLNDYYPVSLKQARLAQIDQHARFEFETIDLANALALTNFVRRVQPDYVVPLAAQAGVRYSLENPPAYVESNLHGFVNLLQA